MKLQSMCLAMCFLVAGTLWGQEGNRRNNGVIDDQVDDLRDELATIGTKSGREFWVAFPPLTSDEPNGKLEIHVTASRRTRVVLEVPRTEYFRSDTVTPDAPLIFSTEDGSDIQWRFVVTESEEAGEWGLLIRAEHPVSVIVHSAIGSSVDAYQVLPAHSLGTQYRHVAYYDNTPEIDNPSTFFRGGGFLLVATEDETYVNCHLQGSGSGQTVQGRRIGDKIDGIRLDRGQTYMVRSDGNPSDGFDLSGTLVESNKPVAFISFHMETRVPFVSMSDAQSHLSEMLPPVSAWGKSHVSRRFEWQGESSGDFFRLVAAEDDTEYSIKLYDENTGKFLEQKTGKLLKAGDYFEPQGNSDEADGLLGELIVWESMKPTLLVQYGVSSSLHNGSPFMLVVPPLEQYVTEKAQFISPNGNGEVKLHVFAVADTGANAQASLSSVKLNGEPFSTRDPKFLSNRVADSDIFWGQVSLPVGREWRIESAIEYAAYMYGPNVTGYYGVPVATAAYKIDQLDTLAPQVSRRVECGDARILATEVRNGSLSDERPQIDQGIALIELDVERSINYSLEYVSYPRLRPYLNESQFEFRLEVQDRSSFGMAYYSVVDRAGNRHYDSLFYEPRLETLLTNPTVIDFENVRVGVVNSRTVEISNPLSFPISIEEISLSGRGSQGDFRLENAPVTPLTLNPEQSIPVSIVYQPSSEDVNPVSGDSDTLIVHTTCNEFRLTGLEGRGVLARIDVEDWHAGVVVRGDRVCHEEGLVIASIGTDTLFVRSLSLSPEASSFSIDGPTDFRDAPLAIPPGKTLAIGKLCFSPRTLGRNEAEILLESDGIGDHRAILRGFGEGVTNGVDNRDASLVDLNEIYPHPLNSGGYIDFRLTEPGHVYCEVVNLLGQVVSVPLDEYKMPGQHQIVIASGTLQSGSYMCRLSVNGRTNARLLVVR